MTALKPSHKPVQRYYDALAEYADHDVVREGAIEEAARGLEDFAEKQHFLNTIYERFFQGCAAGVNHARDQVVLIVAS